MNPASAFRALRPGAWRGRTSQPDPAFPQLPGIIFETAGPRCYPCPDVSVLSMNCGQIIRFARGDNGFLCTGLFTTGASAQKSLISRKTNEHGPLGPVAA